MKTTMVFLFLGFQYLANSVGAVCPKGFTGSKCTKLCVDGSFGADCNYTCHCLNPKEVCDKTTGYCGSGCGTGWHGDGCQTETGQDLSPLAWIIGTLVAFVLVVVAVKIVMFLKRRKGILKDPLPRQISENNKTAFDSAEESNQNDTPQAEPSNFSPPEYKFVNPCYNNIPPDIPLDSLKEYLRRKIINGELQAEFENLGVEATGKHDVGQRPENKRKNRFRNIFPYDHSRVRLAPDGGIDTDYINASFVSGYRDKTTFIATQGPKSATFDDFWRMIWQQNVKKIVMLTALVENNKKKCEQYWPECYEKIQCGNITIETTLSVVRADFTIRTFNIRHKNWNTPSVVTHFHYTNWPDKDVASVPALVAFWKQVKLTDYRVPTVVHCSAGVGRTGAFIALDSLVKEAETENQVNVFLCVAKMREARMFMVQTADQYRFIHEALIEAMESRCTFYTLADFDLKYGTDLTYTTQQEEELKQQFQSLQILRNELTQQRVSATLSSENTVKTNPQILPANRSHVCLASPTAGYSSYIKTVLLPSASQPRFFVATQTPLPETVADFWKLVYEYYCNTVVCLDDSQDALSLYLCEKTSSTVCPFTVETVAVDTTRDSYVLLKKTISNQEQEGSSRDIDVYLVNSMDTATGQLNTAAILELINVLQIGNNENILVHCFDGSRMCGVFCSVMNIISSLNLKKEVDIFLTIRKMQTVRPQFVSTFEQYKFCYDMAKTYIRSSNVYANI